MKHTAKTSKAFKDYEAIIDNMDIENVTEVEVNTLIEEMAANMELDNAEYCVLYGLMVDKFGRR